MGSRLGAGENASRELRLFVRGGRAHERTGARPGSPAAPNMNAYWLDSREAIDADRLRAEGVEHETLSLSAYERDLERLMSKNGYVTQDIVEISAGMPNVDAILA